MTDRELNISLREMARSAGLCDEWYGQWSDEDSIDECLDKAIRGFDFCVNRDYPSLEFIRKHFKKEDLHRHRLFLDEEIDSTIDTNGYVILLGSCKGVLKIDGIVAVTVYLRHDSIVDVEAKNGASVFVTHYDQSSGKCTSDYLSVIKVYEKAKKG